MKIVSLNTWGGRAGRKKILDFFRKRRDIDIFCLQEVWSAPYHHLEGQAAGGLNIDHSKIMVYGLQEIAAALDSHLPYFRPNHLENYGLLMMVSKKLKVIAEGDVFVHKHRGFIPQGDVGLHARNVQFATIAGKAGNITVLNFHGLWNGQGKGDSPDRLAQSGRIIDFLKTLGSPYLFCGDFNLLPDTESMKKLEEFGLRNLIREYGIDSTRTRLYRKPERFADYALASANVAIKDFRVLPEVVSDHKALLVEIEFSP